MNKYRAIGSMNTNDGVIKGTVTYNPQWKKFQVNADGELSGEFDTIEDAVDQLKRIGFKNIKITETAMSKKQLVENKIRKMVKQVLNEGKYLHSSQFNEFEKDITNLVIKYFGEDGCTREDFIGNCSRYLPSKLPRKNPTKNFF